LHDLEMKKLALGAQAAEAELSYYDAIGEKARKSISNVRGEIEKLRGDLVYETKVSNNRKEYEELAKMASSREPSRVTKRKLEVVRSEMDDIRTENNKVQKKLDVKGKQFHLLMQSIADLKNGLEEDKLRERVS